MSMPKFPEVDPKITITCEQALNMILSSIAAEELALSHIINAEGEKLQYVLGTLESNKNCGYCLKDVLAVNDSVAAMMANVAQNQMLLKQKMDAALCAMARFCPGKSPKPPCPPCPPKPPRPEPPPCPPKPPCPPPPDPCCPKSPCGRPDCARCAGRQQGKQAPRGGTGQQQHPPKPS